MYFYEKKCLTYCPKGTKKYGSTNFCRKYIPYLFHLYIIPTQKNGNFPYSINIKGILSINYIYNYKVGAFVQNMDCVLYNLSNSSSKPVKLDLTLKNSRLISHTVPIKKSYLSPSTKFRLNCSIDINGFKNNMISRVFQTNYKVTGKFEVTPKNGIKLFFF